MASGGDGDSKKIGGDASPVPILPALDFDDSEETNSGAKKLRDTRSGDGVDTYVGDVRSPIDPGSRIEVSQAPLSSPYETHLRHAIRRLIGTPSNGPVRDSSYVPGLKPLSSRNNAMAHVAYVVRDDRNLYRIAGYIYDVVNLLADIMQSFDYVESSYRYYSPATIVRDLELTNAGEESGEFTNGAGTVTVKWRRFFDTAFYQFELRFFPWISESDLKPAIDRFAALETFKIMETSQAPVNVANVRRTLGHLLKIANADDISGLLGGERLVEELANIGIHKGSGLFVRDVDAGIGIIGRTVDSVELALSQGYTEDDMQRKLASTNVSKWSGWRLTDGRRGFRWVIRDTDPVAKNADWRSPVSLPLRRFVRNIWGEGVVHVNADMEGVPIDGSGGASMPPVGDGGGGGVREAAGGVENSTSVTGTFDPAEISYYAGQALSDGFGNNFHYRHDRISAHARAAVVRTVQRGRVVRQQIIVPIVRSALMITM